MKNGFGGYTGYILLAIVNVAADAEFSLLLINPRK